MQSHTTNKAPSPGSAAQNRNKIWLREGTFRHFARVAGYVLLVPVHLVILLLSVLIYAIAWLIHRISFRSWLRSPLGESFSLLLISLIVLLGLTLYGPPGPAPASDQQIEVVLERGLGVRQIASKLNQSNVIASTDQFLLVSKLLGVEDALQAGKYSFPLHSRPLDVINRLANGQVSAQMVTIPEGLNIEQMARLLERKSGIDAGHFTALAFDERIARRHGVEASSLEGYLFPDTYGLYWGMSAERVIELLSDRFWQIYDQDMARRAERLGLSLHQVVTLASMIEKEARVPEERQIISAVYHNRLRERMLLQCDPTVIYALGGKETPLTRNDLGVDSPYNTYRRYGLPPGPISNPGKASIQAALDPARTDYLYFVARGDGSHQFSRTSREHINAINRIKKNLGG